VKRSVSLFTIFVLSLTQPVAWAGPARDMKVGDLLPEGEEEIIAHGKVAALIRGGPHGPFDDQNAPMSQLQVGTFNTSKLQKGTRVRIKEFVAPPHVAAGSTSEFPPVPNCGACIHAPTPPLNRTIHVRSAKPVNTGSLSAAVEIESVLRTMQATSETGNSAYALSLSTIRALNRSPL
jgi:hypothetical protein